MERKDGNGPNSDGSWGPIPGCTLEGCCPEGMAGKDANLASHSQKTAITRDTPPEVLPRGCQSQDANLRLARVMNWTAPVLLL